MKKVLFILSAVFCVNSAYAVHQDGTVHFDHGAGSSTYTSYQGRVGYASNIKLESSFVYDPSITYNS